LDGVKYIGSSSNPSTYALLSGDTSTATSARLYNTGISNSLDPDYPTLKLLWKSAIIGTVDYINTYSGGTINKLGKDDEYGAEINYAGITGSTTTKKLLTVSFSSSIFSNVKSSIHFSIGDLLISFNSL
jgi:hypothetical protein